MSTNTTDATRAAETTTTTPRAGAPSRPAADRWESPADPAPATDRAPLQFDPHAGERLPNACDESNQRVQG